MADKCNITPENIKKINSKLLALFIYKRRSYNISDFKKELLRIIDEMKDEYTLENATQISDLIYNHAQRSGIVDQDSNFFSPEFLLQAVIAIKSGI